MDEESYIVRIYRREAVASPIRRIDHLRRRHDRVALVGVVEVVACGERHTFREFEELWALLSRTAPESD